MVNCKYFSTSLHLPTGGQALLRTTLNPIKSQSLAVKLPSTHVPLLQDLEDLAGIFVLKSFNGCLVDSHAKKNTPLVLRGVFCVVIIAVT